MRFRFVFLGLGSILTILLMVLIDPDMALITDLPFGAGVIGIVVALIVSILYIAILHIGRKGLLDYLDLETLFRQGPETADSAARKLIAVGLMMIAIAITILAASISMLMK